MHAYFIMHVFYLKEIRGMPFFNRQCVIGVSLSEPHTYMKYIASVCVYIYIYYQTAQ